MAKKFVSINKLHPLLQEIARQTDINRFTDPYDAVKVQRAAKLNTQVYETDIHNPLDVLELIESTITDLNCEYSAELIYQYLLSIYNPVNNSADFDWCNDLCQQIYNTKDSVGEMIFIVKREIEKKETQKKIELESKRQEKIRQQQLESEKRQETIEQNVKVIGVVFFIIVIFLAIGVSIIFHI